MKKLYSCFFGLMFSLLVSVSADECRNLEIQIFPEPEFSCLSSRLCTENQFHSSHFMRWCNELKESFRFHRKLWEYCYVCEMLDSMGYLKPGQKGLGFGVGQEPLPALFAKYGCYVTASDQGFEAATKQGWTSSSQYTQDKQRLNSRGICEPTGFDHLVELREVDMNNIPADLHNQYDFVWSCCSLEHLGGLYEGLMFIKNSLKCLKKGGIAIHTTEYNISSDEVTVSMGPCVLYRKHDLVNLACTLVNEGYEVIPFNLNPGAGQLDQYIDLPPYVQNVHLKLLLEGYVSTSFGLIVRKP